MENKFLEVMRERSDAELLEIVTRQRDDYQPEALEAAEAELERRELSAPQMEEAKEQVELKALAREQKANKPLGDGWKIFLVLFPGLIALLIAGSLRANGYHRKHKDVWRFTLYGVAGYILFALSCAAIDRAPR